MSKLYSVVKPFYNIEKETETFVLGDIVEFSDENKAKVALEKGVVKEMEIKRFTTKEEVEEAKEEVEEAKEETGKKKTNAKK